MRAMRMFCLLAGGLLLLIASTPAVADVFENFDGFSQAAYGTYTYNGFRMVNALCGSQNARSGNAVRLRDALLPDPNNQPYLEYIGLDGNGKDGGVGTFSFWYRNWDGSPPCVHDVTVSVGGGPYINVGTINTTSTTYLEFSYTLNNPANDIKIRIQRVSGERLLIDDFFIQDYSIGDTIPPSVVSVTPVTNRLFNVLFDEPVDQTTAEDENNYLVMPDNVQPAQAVRDSANTALVRLTFSAPLPMGQHVLWVNNVRDLAGNPAQNDSAAFVVTSPGYLGTVVITEVMYDDAEGDDEEWLEIHNTTDSTINISGWIVTDAAEYPPASEGWFVVPEGTFIAPGEYLVLSTAPLPQIEGEIVCAIGVRSGFGNTGDNIALYTALQNGELVDGSLTVNYPDMAYSNAGNSIEKCDPNAPWSGSTADWHQSVHFYDQGRYQHCTPGAPNSPCGVRTLSICDLRAVGVCGLPRELWNPVNVCGLVTFIDTCRSLAWLESGGCATAIYGPVTRTIMQNSNRIMATGDSVCVTGYLALFNGLAEFAVLFTVHPVVTFISENNALPAETNVAPSQISSSVAPCAPEFLESKHIRVANVTFLEGNGTNVFVGNRNYNLVSGTDTIQFRVSVCDTALVGDLIPVGPVTLHGILQQYDPTPCYCEGYQVVTGRVAAIEPGQCATPVAVTVYRLEGEAVELRWQPGENQSCDCYSVYYATAADAPFPEGYTLLTNVFGATTYLDTSPLAQKRFYIVTAGGLGCP